MVFARIPTVDYIATFIRQKRANNHRKPELDCTIAQYECVKVLSETEFSDDLKAINVPMLVMHGEDDQICPLSTTAARSVKLLKHGTLKSSPGLPCLTESDNACRFNQRGSSCLHPVARLRLTVRAAHEAGADPTASRARDPSSITSGARIAPS